MLEVVFLIVLATIWLIFAIVEDFKKKEISNWLNFSLIIFALGFRFFYCLFGFSGEWGFFYQGLIGLGVFFVLHNLFYYGRIFAGGDAKLMLALGAILPFSKNMFVNLQIFFAFILLFLISGAVYGLIASIYLGIKNSKRFNKEFRKRFKSSKKMFYFSLVFSLLFLICSFFEFSLFYLAIFVFVLPYLYLFAKSIDESCMVKNVNTKNLTEGDWLYKDVNIRGKKIKATWDGLTKREILLLRKHKKNVLIRQGIVFAPVFFISFLCLVFLWFFGVF